MNTNKEKVKDIVKEKKRRISVFEKAENEITKFDIESKEQEKSCSNDKSIRKPNL